MTTVSATTRTSIWHVCNGDGDRCGPTASRVQATLRAFGGAVEAFHDVYRTLVRLCAKDSPSPRALLVCVDDLGRAEMEFFSIVSRIRRDVPVYVYGEERARHRVERAVALGAVEADEAAIFALVDDDVRNAPPIHHLSIPPPRSRDDSAPLERTSGDEKTIVDGSPCAPAESHTNPCGSSLPVAPQPDSIAAPPIFATQAPLDDDETPPHADNSPSAAVSRNETAVPTLRLAAAPDEIEYATADANEAGGAETPPRVEEVESDRPARVPWLRYDDRPVRLPPRRASSPNDDGSAKIARSSNGSPVARAEDPAAAAASMNPPSRSLSDLRFEPLLTEEELRALLGDELEELDSRAADRDPGSVSP